MKEIRIGIPSFEQLICNDLVYIDKTAFIYNLVRKPGYYFFSRPRRFGKSLLVSTLEQLFAGKRALFKGLAIDDFDYDWKPYPVISMTMARLTYRTAQELDSAIDIQLNNIVRAHSLSLPAYQGAGGKLDIIVQMLKEKYGQNVVLLIDEYDKPIVDHLANPQLAKELRDVMASFYGVIKGLGEHLHFVFITGVSKFAQMSLFSKLNSLNDMSFDARYAALAGYTQDELESYFTSYHDRACNRLGKTSTQLFDDIKKWYNGYRFSREHITVYNPHSILSFYDKNILANFWSATGTPTFLYRIIKEKGLDARTIVPSRIEQGARESYEPDNVPLTQILLQTGYLTIADIDDNRMLYRLDFPNYEVRDTFYRELFAELTYHSQGTGLLFAGDLAEALMHNDIKQFCAVLKQVFANIPAKLHVDREAYYHSIIFVVTLMMRFWVEAEAPTSQGFIDLVVQTTTHVYLFEFKLNQSAQIAMKQIKDKRYYEKFLALGKKVVLVGVSFDDRTVNGDPLIEELNILGS